MPFDGRSSHSHDQEMSTLVFILCSCPFGPGRKIPAGQHRAQRTVHREAWFSPEATTTPELSNT